MSPPESTARPLEPQQDPLAIKPKMTMREILQLMQAADEGLLSLDIDEMRELAKSAQVKVDNYRLFISKLEAEAARLEAEAEPTLRAAKTLRRKAASIENLLTWHLREHGMTSMPGEKSRVLLKTSQSVKVRPEADPGAYVRYADYMRLKYEWDKNKLTAALKADEAAAKEIAEFEVSYKIKFEPIVRIEEA